MDKSPKKYLEPNYVPDMGSHLILDYCGITSLDLNSFEEVDKFLTDVIVKSSGTIEGKQYKVFEPQGLSIIYLLSESHFSIHTWPENNACAIDFYHCGNEAQSRMKRAEELLSDHLGWENCSSSIIINRGKICQNLLNDYPHSATVFKNTKIEHRTKSEFQDIRVYESEDMGKILALDNIITTTEDVNSTFTYDMIKGVISRFDDFEKVAVVGAGDLCIPIFLLERFPKVKEIFHVEIDKKVIDVRNEYFGKNSDYENALKSKKLQLIHDDGSKFIKKCADKGFFFDAIIIDSVDLYSPNENIQNLFNANFYYDLYCTLKNGALFSQMLSDQHYKEKFEKMVRKAGFSEISFIYSYVPEYSTTVPIGVCKKS